MSNTSNEPSTESFFGKVISTYTRAQAIEDEVLIDAGAMAREAGFKWPVALTVAAWADCVAWSEDDSRRQIYQDESGRLWDLIYMASHAIRTSKDSGDRLLFQLYRVPRDGQSLEAELVTLRLIVGPGDAGEPVVTILQPHED
ncbi:MAG: hypothetical protein KME65_13235 [Candidatus Thiodiazotropha sp. (ex Ctena orbiculata)]|uniref:Uncharacterized protein n=1 Tax=Candidatus Thiodiazotropha taylori TaxID=2792791 RepID=A0A944QW19_9GAMM|nr:hypothetical protein [Candidatus Thiodiazotropha taylori]